ncbi:MAG: superoxide dismutase [Alphaproteobacteria bacterium]|nr:superoxide dismutase [Alphaproteobacteria bacterium]
MTSMRIATSGVVSRRQAMSGAVCLAGAAAVGTIFAPHVARAQAPHALPPLPWADNALDPVISSNTIGFHYGKHHKGYLDAMNAALGNGAKDLAPLPLLDLMKTTSANPGRAALFNAAAQVWNHTFYWSSLRPGGGGKPPAGSKIAAKIDSDLGGYDKFRETMKATSVGQFASGWGWLVEENGKLACVRTPNAETPATVQGRKPLLTIDVWEHAYYLDYQNRRADYVDALLDKLINWEFAEKNLG